MKKLTTQTMLAFFLLAGGTQAQNLTNSISPAAKPRIADMVSTYRIGKQGVSLWSLNQSLQQAGYAPMSNQFTVIGFQSQMNSSRSRLTILSQFDFAVAPSSDLTTSNGTNTAKGYFSQIGLGAGYRIINREKFTLMPKLMLSPTFFSLTVSKNNNPQASLATILVDPSAQAKATLTAGSLASDLGLMGQYRFAYKSTTKQTECSTETQERSLVVGFDLGYRLAADIRFGNHTSVGDDQSTLNLSGWYAAVRIGLGRRYKTTNL